MLHCMYPGKIRYGTLTDQGRRVGFLMRQSPNLTSSSLPETLSPISVLSSPHPQFSVLPMTTRKPAIAPPPGAIPSCSEGQHPLEWLPPLPIALAFQQTWGWGPMQLQPRDPSQTTWAQRLHSLSWQWCEGQALVSTAQPLSLSPGSTKVSSY